jgi:D-arabinose 1-dehydrogenase-like Zn-dependent alcohol dehydrogenase
VELHLETINRPGEVRIEVKAAAINPADLMLRDPGWPNMTSNIVPGMEPQESSNRSGQAYRAYIPARR